jgi:hypothetical protein
MAVLQGGFITAPADVSHFTTVKGRTIVQVHAIGPFDMTYVNPLDDPRTRACTELGNARGACRALRRPLVAALEQALR